MTTRGASASFLTGLTTYPRKIVRLIEFNFSTVLRLTDHSRDLTYSSNTYTASGDLLSISDIPETYDMSVQHTDVVLSGANASNMTVALGENSTNKQVLIYKALIDTTNDSLIDANLDFDGRIDNYTIVNNPQTRETFVRWTLANQFADFDMVAGRRANSQDQQLYFSTDRFFDYAGLVIQDFKWNTPR